MTLTHFLPFPELKIYTVLRKKNKTKKNREKPLLQTGTCTRIPRANKALYFAIFFYSPLSSMTANLCLARCIFPCYGMMAKGNVTEES